jgi:hypothetical protein
MLLADCYPRERDRERAVRWLGWVAYHWGTQPVAWWEIPDQVPGQWLARTRFAVAVVIVAAALGTAIGFSLWVAIMLLLVVVVSATKGVMVLSLVRLRVPRPGPPRRVTPRWPREPDVVTALAICLISVVAFIPALVYRWTEPAHGDPVLTYRTDRRATAARLAAWLGSAGLVAALVLGAGVPVGGWLGVDLSLATGAGLIAALRTSPYPVVKLTELLLLAQWRQPVALHRVLTSAVASQVLMRAGEQWEFRDETVRVSLAAAHAAELRERDRAREARAARATGARVRLVALMDARGIARARADLAAGIAIFFLLLGLTLAHGRWPPMVVFSAIAMVAGLICYAFAARLLRAAVSRVQWTVVNVAPFARRTRLVAAGVTVAVGALLVATAGPSLAAFAAMILPALLVALCGGWVLVVTRRAPRPGYRLGRRSRGSMPGAPESASESGHPRGWRQAAWWHRRLRDTVVAAATGTTLLALARRDVLAVEPSAGLLFPMAAWASYRAWRAMNDAGRLAVRAAADITLSLLLGADLVLLMVWLANLLGLTRSEVATIRDAVERAGDLADLPWQLWAGLYGGLALAAIAFALRPARLRRATEVSHWVLVVPAVNVVRRVLTGVHIGLLVIVLVAVAGPVAVFPVLRGQLAARYAVAYQRQLAAAGEQAAYAEISGQFTMSQANRVVLAGIVEKIHAIDHPRPGDGHATGTETDLARRVGELQAAALLATGPKSAATGEPVAASEQSAAAAAGFSVPIRDAPDLRTRATKLEEQDKKEEAARKRAEQAGELAAATVANLLSIPDIGSNEVVQIVREYLSGLVEESPLKDIFAAWTERLAGAVRPPDAETLAVPVPEVLATEALIAQFKAEAQDHFFTKLPSTEHESAVDAAVDMTNQVRYLSEGGSGPCAGCARSEPHDEHFHEPVIEEHPIP